MAVRVSGPDSGPVVAGAGPAAGPSGRCPWGPIDGRNHRPSPETGAGVDVGRRRERDGASATAHGASATAHGGARRERVGACSAAWGLPACQGVSARHGVARAVTPGAAAHGHGAAPGRRGRTPGPHARADGPHARADGPPARADGPPWLSTRWSRGANVPFGRRSESNALAAELWRLRPHASVPKASALACRRGRYLERCSIGHCSIAATAVSCSLSQVQCNDLSYLPC
jgi:hypothetical protein